MNVRGLMIAALVLCGCSSSSSAPAPIGPPPALKPNIIDRMGRAAVSTALVAVLADSIPKNEAHDTYNSTDRPDWVTFSGPIATNLAVYDALDARCGNQILAETATTATRYNTFATALADDRLYVNSASGACTQYLAVELDATELAANDDCGGRTLLYDVIDTTYSALAIGAPSGVSDGVDRDEETHSLTVFPFVAPP